MECSPTVREEVEVTALPLASVTVAKGFPLSLKVTVPVMLPSFDDTVAVKVTDCKTNDGFADDCRLVAVGLGGPLWVIT